jgi:peptide chain release factor subunit 1
MATTVTTPVLRELAGFRAENGCAISIYLDLDPSSSPTASELQPKFNAVLSQAEKEAESRASDRECRLALREDLERIRRWWDDEFDRDGVRGVAVFASSADEFFRALPLSQAVGDAARIGRTLYLSPLAGQSGWDGDLVAVVSRERGTIYRLEAGRLVEILDETEEQPGQHDQGGWSQARYKRHIENLVHQHLKTVGGELDKTLRSGRRVQMVVVTTDEMRTEFDRLLSHATREAIIGWATAEAHAGPAELLEVVRPLLDEAHARHEEETLERWQEAHGRGERAAAGWKQTLDAASDARVEVLLLEEQPQRLAWQCPHCGRASADGGKCPLDGAKLEEEPDGADLAIHQTLLHGGSVIRLGPGALGDQAAGIAALLRF